MGSTPSEDDVISDGQPWVYFDPQPGADGKRMVVDGGTPATTFFVWLKPHKCHSSCTPAQLAIAEKAGTPEDCHEVSSPSDSVGSALAPMRCRQMLTQHTCDAL